MDLMARITIRDWPKLTHEERINKIKIIQAMRTNDREEALKKPVRKSKAKTTSTKPRKKKTLTPEQIASTLKNLSPEQLEAIKKSYGL